MPPDHRATSSSPGGFVHWLSETVGSVIRGLLRRRKGDPMRTYDEAFEPIDVQALQGELNLAEDARRFGERDLPSRNDRQLDGPQERIRQRILGEVAEAYRRANRESERLFDALRGRSVEALVEQALALPGRLVEEARIQRREVTHRLDSLVAQRVETRDRIAAYRERHQVGREPEIKEDHQRRLLLSATIALGIVQALANSILFGQGMDRGLSQAWLLAVVVGAADVGWHFCAGRLGSRIHGHRWFERIPGGLGLLLLAVTIPAWNLALVHLRLAIRSVGVEEGMESWLPSMLAAPFGFDDFPSFLLLGVGLLCSTLAVVTAWTWDEPIPEYRKLARRLQELDADIGYWRDHDDRLVKDIVQEAEEELERMRRDIDGNVSVAEAIAGRMERLKSNLDSFLAGAHMDYATLVRIYRDENRLARTSEPPAYFDEPIMLEVEEPLEIRMEDYRVFMDGQRNHLARLQALPTELTDHVRARVERPGREQGGS